MKTGAAYIRVSTDQQMELSPESQRHEIEKYAKANDIVLSNEYIFMEEEGRSGRKSANRPEFQRMIGMAKAQPKPFDVVIVWKFSRFARNQEESIVYKSMLRSKCDIEIVSVSEPLVDGPFGSLIERIIEWMDEYYSIRLSGEVLRGMAEKAHRGGVVGSPAFGYKVSGGIFVPVPEEAEILRMVFHRFVYDQTPMRELAIQLNALGVRTKRGSPIENRTIDYMLHNPVYIGKIRWSKSGHISRDYDKTENVIFADGHHEPIISDELFALAQEKLAERKKIYPRYAHETANRQEYLLRGIIRCSNCNSTLIYSPANAGLQCHSYGKGSCKKSHYISAAQANARVLDLIEQYFQQEDFPLEHRSRAASGEDQRLIEAQIQRERQKLSRVKAAYADGVDTLDEYRINKERIQKAIDALVAKKETPPAPAELVFKKFVEDHKGAVEDLRNPDIGEDAKNLILRGFVDYIVFNREKNRFQIYFYD